MDDTHSTLMFGALVALIACSAFFSSSETGMLSLNRYRLRHMTREGNKAAQRASALLERPDRLLGTILVGNNVVNILAASLATVLAVDIWGEAGIAISTALLTVVVLIFGEITPKTLAALRPELIAFPASWVLQHLQRLLYPVVWIANAISNLLLRMMGVDPEQGSNDSLSTEELRSVVREAGQGLPANRKDMLLGILDLEKVTVNDIMVPRNEVIGIDLDMPIEQIVRQLRGTTFTRLPIYCGDLNQVEGIVHMRQIARLLTQNKLTLESLKSICVPPYFVPESTPLSTQLINFQQEKRRIGIVVDEYGDVIGVVTLEDILEEIVGDFTSQPSLHGPEISEQADGSWLAEGTTTIRELNKTLGWELPCDGPKTLNGMVTEQLESIPDCPVCLQIDGYRVEILQASGNRVKSLRIWEVSSQSEPAAADG